MSRQKMGLFGALATVGAVGALAGLAWRWAQRRRGAGLPSYHELNRWEDEGGALAGAAGPVAQQTGAASLSSSESAAAVESSNGGAAQAWPFPHSTRH